MVLWLYNYDFKKSLLGDLSAGLTIFAFVIPHSMALSSFLGLPPIYGLYSCIFPAYIYAIVGPNQKLSMGPMAITTLILAVNINSLGYTRESPDLTSIVLTTTFLIGLCSLVMGMLNLGWMSKYISPSVLIGFVSASGISIGINQSKYILGIKVPSFAYLHETVFYLCKHIGEANKYSIILGLSTWLILYLIAQWKKSYKGDMQSHGSDCSLNLLHRVMTGAAKFSSFLALFIGAIVSRAMILNGCELDVVGTLPSGLLKPNVPIFDVAIWMKLFPTAVVITLVSFATNLSIAMKFGSGGPDSHASQELVAFGLANILGPVCNSFISTGAIGRSAINVEAGATTQMSAVISSSLVLVSVLFCSSAFYYIPMTILAAVIEANVPVMIDFSSMIAAYQTKKGDFVVMVTAFLITLFVGESEGLFIGMVVSFMVLIHHHTSPNIAHLGKLPVSEGGHFRDVLRFPSAEQLPGIAIVRMDATLFFANCEHFKDVIMQAAAGHFHTNSSLPIEKLVIDAKCWIDIDLAGLSTLRSITQELSMLPLKPIIIIVHADDEVAASLAYLMLGVDKGSNRLLVVRSIEDAIEVKSVPPSVDIAMVEYGIKIATGDNDPDVRSSYMKSSSSPSSSSSSSALTAGRGGGSAVMRVVSHALQAAAMSRRNAYDQLAIHDDDCLPPPS